MPQSCPPHRGDGQRGAWLPLIQVTHRLTLSPTAAVELMKGLSTTMTTLKANAQRKMQQGDQPAAFSLPTWEEIRAEPEFSQRK
jgi:hypothetical protein